MKAVFILWILAVDVACAVMLVVFLLLPPNAWSQFAAVGLLLCSLNAVAISFALEVNRG